MELSEKDLGGRSSMLCPVLSAHLYYSTSRAANTYFFIFMPVFFYYTMCTSRTRLIHSQFTFAFPVLCIMLDIKQAFINIYS